MEPSKIIRLGNPILRQLSLPVAEDRFGSEELKAFAEELFFHMKKERGIGLAAPQIGVNQRAIVFGMDEHPLYTDCPAIPYTVLFNPSFVPKSENCVDSYEGCLSVDNVRGKVSRYQSIYYRGFDVDGNLIEREVSDLHARVLQHEYDHLEGVIFLDRVTDHHSLGFHDELVKSGAFS